MSDEQFNKHADEQRMQSLLGAALAPRAGAAPPPDLVERIMAATLPRLKARRSVVARIGMAAGALAAAACVLVAVGLSLRWSQTPQNAEVAWGTAEESRLAGLAQADIPREHVELELRTLALAVQDARTATEDDWSSSDELADWMQDEAAIGVF